MLPTNPALTNKESARVIASSHFIFLRESRRQLHFLIQTVDCIFCTDLLNILLSIRRSVNRTPKTKRKYDKIYKLYQLQEAVPPLPSDLVIVKDDVFIFIPDIPEAARYRTDLHESETFVQMLCCCIGCNNGIEL